MSQPVRENVPSASEPLDIGAIARSCLKHWKLVLAITAAVTLAMAFYVRGQTKIYRATLSIQIDPSAIRPLGNEVQAPGDSTNVYWTNKEYYETQYKILESRKIAEQVVLLLHLNRDAHFLKNLPADAKAPPLTKEVPVSVAAEVVRSRLSATPIKNSRLVEVAFEDADPARAQRILNALADTYIQQNLNSSVSNIGSAAEWLNDQLTKLKLDLEKAELALHEYKKEKRLLSASLDDKSNMLRDEMQQLNGALTTARAHREHLAARVEQMGKVDPKNPELLPTNELLNSSMLQNLRRTYMEAKTALESMKSAGRGDNHPEVLAAAATAEATRQALLSEIINITEAGRRDLAAATGEVNGLAGLYGAAEQKAFDLNLLEIEYRRLARSKENTERLYSVVLERSKDSELSGQLRFNNVKVLDPPLLPTRPVKPLASLMIALGATGGLLLGLGVVLLRERLDSRLKLPPDVEATLGLPCIGTIPHITDESGPDSQERRRGRAPEKAEAVSRPELWIHQHPHSNVAEAVRTLRTNLVFMSPDRPFSRLLVTSAGPMDGKTTIATSLAVTLAQSGKSVLLIDADLRRPRIHKIFNLPSLRSGVTTALLRPETLDELIQKSEVPNLSVLPAGPLPPNPAELLHSSSFERLLDAMATRFECLVIDSPPLVPVTDAAILSRLVDATVLVVRSMSTRKDHAKRALRTLKDVNAVVAGCALNGVDMRRGGYGYYQYYSYAPEQAPRTDESAA